MKGFICLAFTLLMCSCATIKTIEPANNHVNIAHNDKKSYCKTIPRVYSGVSYNICLMYGEPSHTKRLGNSYKGIPFFVIDAAFSAVADTVVLPYTIYTQINEGAIDVN